MQLTQQLAGKVVREVWTNGTTILIRCECGFELQVGWADDQGKPVQGKPVIVFAGKNIRVVKPRTLQETPHVGEVGIAELMRGQ